MGHAKGSVDGVPDSSAAANRCCLRPRSFKNKVEDEIEGRSGGIDRVWQMGESKRNPQESEPHSIILLTGR